MATSPNNDPTPMWTMLDGVLVPNPPGLGFDIIQNVKNIKEMAIREDDVLVCALPKAGTHWTWEIVSMLQKGKAEIDPRSKTALMLEFVPIAEIDKPASPRVLNTHLLFRHLPKQCLEKKTKIIYIVRNAKDFAVSYYHHMKSVKLDIFDCDFSEFLRRFVLSDQPSINDYFFVVRDWEREIEKHPDHPILQLSYEDMKEDLVTQVRRIAEFLEVVASEELIQQVAKACSFTSLKAAEKTKVMDPAVEEMMRPDYTMFRKGEVGDWKNWFTVAENEAFEDYYRKKMEGSKVKCRFTL